MLTPVRASAANEVVESQVVAPRWLVSATLSYNVYSYLGVTSSAAATSITPDKRGTFGQQVGVGYQFHPNFSLRLGLNFAEALYGYPNGASVLTTIGATPWVVFAAKGFFIGAGPFFAIWTYGKNGFDLGTWTALGYTLGLPENFALSVGASLTTMFLQRTCIAINPAITISRRF